MPEQLAAPRLALLAVLLFPLSFVRATANPVDFNPEPQADSSDSNFFERRIRPLLIRSCLECHSGDDPAGGLSLESREQILTGGDRGPAFVPGSPLSSLLLDAVDPDHGELEMPPENPLPVEEVQWIRKWIQDGLHYPQPSAAWEKSQAGPASKSQKSLWSLQPLSSPQNPTAANRQSETHPIDRLLGSGADLQAGSEDRASLEILARRLSYTLTGLPPSAEDLSRMRSEGTDHGFTALMEQYLLSPRYGEHWGRHWLDVVRYADSNGLDENLAYGNAWRYRDYVIRSLNEDKPYDQFVVEQLAGDLLSDADENSRTATGFLLLGAKVLAEPDLEKLLADTVDEQIDTTGKVFLGLTLGCARCHDHKFDPISQEDYYRLAAVFRSTRSFSGNNTGAIKHWNEVSVASDEEASRIADVEKEITARKAAASSFLNQARAALRKQAEEQVVEYLAAAVAARQEPAADAYATVAADRELNPRILKHCLLHLEYHRTQLCYQAWHESAAINDEKAVRLHYEQLLGKRNGLSEAVSESPAAAQLREDIRDPSGLLAVPSRPEEALSPDQLAEYHRLADAARIFESSAPDLPSVMSVEDGEIMLEHPIHRRGNHLDHGRMVPRGIPQALQFQGSATQFTHGDSGRLELARWISHPKNPLTARVFVNRVWGWHFGRPLVRTTENFGYNGAIPQHKELLDYLAQYLIDSDWSLKSLHRLILTSSAWQAASLGPTTSDAADSAPSLSTTLQFQRRRLDAEQLRDSVLAAAGLLDLSVGGKTVPLRNRQFVFDHTSIDHTRYDSRRRAVYLPVIRNNLYPMFRQFDFPDPTMPCGHRDSTTVPSQALWFMNSELVMDAAAAVGSRCLQAANGDARRTVREIWMTIYGRRPRSGELAAAEAFLNQQRAPEQSPPPDGTDNEALDRAAAKLCQILFASNEFCILP